MRLLEVMTEHTNPFKILIEVLKEMLPEANIEFRRENNLDGDGDDGDSNNKDRDGIRIRAVDTTKTVLIDLRLHAEKFSEFKCLRKKLVLGVNLTSFHKMIKIMDKEDHLTLFVDHNDVNKLQIRIDSPERRRETIYKLKLLDLGQDQITVPITTFESVVITKANEFHKVCREMVQLGAEYIEIKCSENKLSMACKTDVGNRETTYEIGSDEISIKWDNDNEIEIVQGIYELKNLVLFSKCTSLCDDIEIYLKNDYPLVIKYTVATLGRLLLCLTPVNDDMEDCSDEYSDNELELK